MLKPPLPADEIERLRVLQQLRLLDTAPEEAFDALTRLASELLDVPIALVSLVDASRQWFKSRQGLAEPQTSRDVAFCAHAILGRETFVVGDAATDQRFHDNPLVLDGPRIRAYMGVPLVSHEGHALGTLCAIDQRPREFTAREIRILEDLARICQREIQSRELALQAGALAEERQRFIEEREAVYRATVDGAAVGMAVVSRDGCWRLVNRRLCEILGRDADDLLCGSFREVTHPDDLAADMALRDQLLQGRIERGTREKRYLKPDGDIVWAHVEATLQRDCAGRPEALILAVQDITARREAEQALRQLQQQLEHKVEERTRELQQANRFLAQSVREREQSEAALAASEQELKAVLANALDAYIAIGDDGCVRDWNAQAERTFGWSHAEAVGRPLEALIIPDRHASGHLAGLLRVNRGGASQVLNQRLTLPARCRDGREITCEVAITRLPHGPRGTLYAAFLQDVSEREAVQRRLAQSEAQLSDLYEHAPCGYHSLGPDGRFLRINATGQALFGCPAEALVGQARPWDFFVGATAQGCERQFRELIERGHIGPLEFDLRSRDGVLRRVSVRASAVTDADGRFLMSRSVMFDITELHQARQLLEAAHRQQGLMLDNDLIGIVKLRGHNAIWHNRAFASLFGYGDGEALGLSARELYPDDATFERISAEAAALLARGGTYRTQLAMRHRSGRPLWVDMSGTVLAEGSDESLWLMLDISEAKARQDRAEAMAYTDALTGLPNRAELQERLAEACAGAQRAGRLLGVCFLDLNGFKAVNDTRGHEAGDQLLRLVAARLTGCVRGDDTVARLGGDEFVLLLPHLAAPEEADPVVARIREALTEPCVLAGGTACAVTASIGLAFFPRDGHDGAALLAHADAAMYRAKRAQR